METENLCSLRVLLEAVSTAAKLCPWGVSPIPSAGCFFAWDARDDSAFAILDSVCGQFGTVDQSAAVEAGGQTIIGCIVKPTDTGDLTDAAGRLRVAYSIATGGGGPDAPSPF